MTGSPGTSGSSPSSFLSQVLRDQHMLLLLKFCQGSYTLLYRSLWERMHLHDLHVAEKDVDLVWVVESLNQILLIRSDLACFLGRTEQGLHCHWQETAIYPSEYLRAKPCTWTQRCQEAGDEMAVLAQRTLQSQGTVCWNYSGYWCSDGSKWSNQHQILTPSCTTPGSACHSLSAGLGFKGECGCLGERLD